jgi:hypothetical protein
MQAPQHFLYILPVLPSADIARDVKWYQEQTGFEPIFADKMYAVLQRDGQGLHLQWHADTTDDPLLGGSVIRIGVKNILPLVEEFVNRGTISREKFIEKTPWNTREFGFFDLNNNAIFIAEDLGE